jgi:hypothetical protein
MRIFSLARVVSLSYQIHLGVAELYIETVTLRLEKLGLDKLLFFTMRESQFEALRKVILSKEEPSAKDLQILLEGAANLISESRQEVRADLMRISKTPEVLMNDPSPAGETLARFFRLAENESSTMDTVLRQVLLYIKTHISRLFFADSDATSSVARVLEGKTEGALQDLQQESMYLGAQPFSDGDPFSAPVGYKGKSAGGLLMPTSTVWKKEKLKNEGELKALEELDRSVDELDILSTKSGEGLSAVGTSEMPDNPGLRETITVEHGFHARGTEAFEVEDRTALPAPILNARPARALKLPSSDQEELELEGKMPIKKPGSPIRPRKSEPSKRLKSRRLSSQPPAPVRKQKSSTASVCGALIIGFVLGLIPYASSLFNKAGEKPGAAALKSREDAQFLAFIERWNQQVKDWREEESWSTTATETLTKFDSERRAVAQRIESRKEASAEAFEVLASASVSRMKDQIACVQTLVQVHYNLTQCEAADKSTPAIVETTTGFALKRTSRCHALLLEGKDLLERSGEISCQRLLRLALSKVRSFEYKVIKHYVTSRKRIRNRAGILSLLRQASKEIDPEEVVLKEEMLQKIYELSKK